ncbi:DUF1192 domain-containing protein [Sphingomonas sp.]|uniref:DUF1192 domain-containing protein n=1 Tax=Sphingomonas sp. TaxID=28214 RepID=UPI002BC9FDDE|nr:DUF1192 domain-containing protein [Sphingomonas sp.]HTG38919.1 DUF1192 domain-containing protein [Sphingomonas sp.]
MEADDNLPRQQGDLLTRLRQQDLDPLSVAELQARIDALEVEVTRVRMHMERAGTHRASAEALFRR